MAKEDRNNDDDDAGDEVAAVTVMLNITTHNDGHGVYEADDGGTTRESSWCSGDNDCENRSNPHLASDRAVGGHREGVGQVRYCAWPRPSAPHNQKSRAATSRKKGFRRFRV